MDTGFENATKYKVIDLLNTNWLKDIEWTAKEIVNYFRELTKDEGATIYNYNDIDDKKLIDNVVENLDINFIERNWFLKFVPVNQHKGVYRNA